MSIPPVVPEMTIQAPGQPEVALTPPAPIEAPVAAPEAPTTPPPAPDDTPFTEEQSEGEFKIKLATGEVFKGKTEKEAYQNLAKSKVMTTLWAKGKGQLPDDQTLRILRPDLFPEPAQPKPGETPTPTETAPTPEALAQVSQEILSGMVADAPTAIARGMAHSMGFESPEALKADYADMRAFVDQLKGELAASQFLTAAPDFPNTKEAVAAVSKVLTDLNAAWTPQNLQIAHAYCVKQGVYQPVAQAPTVTPNQPPPLTPQGQPTAAPNAVNIWDLRIPLEQLERR